jgi:molybdopterin biosynthesis enzyme
MIKVQQSMGPLTPVDKALALVCDGLSPVAPRAIPILDARGSVTADGNIARRAVPLHDMALVDGWALRAYDLVGASSYAPVMLTAPPVWVDAGDRMPHGCDCVLEAAQVERTGARVNVLAEAIPGQGVRRAGGDIGEGRAIAAGGLPLSALDLLVARAAGVDVMSVRRPRMTVVALPSVTGDAVTARLIAEEAQRTGADVTVTSAQGRDAASIVAVLESASCDVLLTVGGTGTGRTDAVVLALAARGAHLVHGLALQPGRTAAVGKLKNVPVVALPGAPDQALAVWWTLARPVLDRLAGRRGRRTMTLPLARKISSSPGVSEVVLLQQVDDRWTPLAIGDLSLDHLARADAWLAVPGDSEGYAAGTPCAAYLLPEC